MNSLLQYIVTILTDDQTFYSNPSLSSDTEL